MLKSRPHSRPGQISGAQNCATELGQLPVYSSSWVPFRLLSRDIRREMPFRFTSEIHIQTWGESGFPYFNWHYEVRSGYHWRRQIPTIVSHTQKRWFAVGNLVINAGRTAPGASLSRPMNPDQKRIMVSPTCLSPNPHARRQAGAQSLISGACASSISLPAARGRFAVFSILQ